MLGMQRTIPRNKRQAQRERQQEYNRELTMQVTSKQQQKLKEMAQKHADKYSSQFGLVNQIASAPDSGFSTSPRYAKPSRPEYPAAASGFGGGGLARTRIVPRDERQEMAGATRLNDRIIMGLEDRFRQVSKAFLAADVDRSGSLEVGELRRLCTMYNLPTDKVEAAFSLSDMDRNGKIEYQEFVQKLVRPDYPINTNAPMPGMGSQMPYGGDGGGDGGRRGGNTLGSSTLYKNTTTSMWQGPGTTNEDVRTKRTLQSEYQQELGRQVEERKARERKAKQLEMEDERRAQKQANQHNPWGRGGAGAPLTDERGHMITDLRDVHEVGNLGGLSPKFDRLHGGSNMDGGGNMSSLGTNYQRVPSYGSPSRLTRNGLVRQDGGGHGGHGGGGHGGGGSSMLPPTLTGNGRFRMSNAPPEKQMEYTARATKQEALKSVLSVQIEEKKQRQKLDKQRRMEMERREEERVRRELAEMTLQYQLEHKEKQKKEADLAEANRLQAEQAKAQAEAARKSSAAVLDMPPLTRVRKEIEPSLEAK